MEKGYTAVLDQTDGLFAIAEAIKQGIQEEKDRRERAEKVDTEYLRQRQEEAAVRSRAWDLHGECSYGLYSVPGGDAVVHVGGDR